MFDITRADYENERDVFEMWRWIDSTTREIWAREDCNTVIFERPGQLVRRFFEEVIPIALFGLHLHHPGLGVSIRCNPGSQPFDAIVRLVDPGGEEQFKVEATTAEDE